MNNEPITRQLRQGNPPSRADASGMLGVTRVAKGVRCFRRANATLSSAREWPLVDTSTGSTTRLATLCCLTCERVHTCVCVCVCMCVCQTVARLARHLGDFWAEGGGESTEHTVADVVTIVLVWCVFGGRTNKSKWGFSSDWHETPNTTIHPHTITSMHVSTQTY